MDTQLGETWRCVNLEFRARRQGMNNENLEAALEQLITAQAQLTAAQASLTQTQTSFLERMAQVEADFQWIKATLIRHEAILENLPDAVKAKIGFQGK